MVKLGISCFFGPRRVVSRSVARLTWNCPAGRCVKSDGSPDLVKNHRDENRAESRAPRRPVEPDIKAASERVASGPDIYPPDNRG